MAKKSIAHCAAEKWKIIISFEFSVAGVCVQISMRGEMIARIREWDAKRICSGADRLSSSLAASKLKPQLTPSPGLRVTTFSLVLVSHDDCDEFHRMHYYA